MADISTLRKMLAWKLLKGSHTWPGPDGGTRIVEAAIVAAAHAIGGVAPGRYF